MKSRLFPLGGVARRCHSVPAFSFEDGIEELTLIAEKLSRDDGASERSGIRDELRSFQERYVQHIGRDGMPFWKRTILEAFFLRRFGLTAFWYPRES